MLLPLSIIIPTYNRHSVLKQTIESLCAGVCSASEIIIVDQSPVPFDPGKIAIPVGIKIRVIQSEIPSSTSARNIGISHAKEENILFCDDDILVDAHSLERLYETLKDASVGLVCAMHYELSGVFTPSKRISVRDVMGTLLGLQKFWRKDGYIIKSNLRGRYPKGITQRVPSQWAQGYFFAVKKQILKQMDHFFDESLTRYAYAEDLDFTVRYIRLCDRRRMSCYLDPRIYVNHLVTREWRVPKEEEVYHLFANRRYLQHKLFPNNKWYPILMRWFDYLFYLSQRRNEEYAFLIKKALEKCQSSQQDILQGKGL